MRKLVPEKSFEIAESRFFYFKRNIVCLNEITKLSSRKKSLIEKIAYPQSIKIFKWRKIYYLKGTL